MVSLKFSTVSVVSTITFSTDKHTRQHNCRNSSIFRFSIFFLLFPRRSVNFHWIAWSRKKNRSEMFEMKPPKQKMRTDCSVCLEIVNCAAHFPLWHLTQVRKLRTVTDVRARQVAIDIQQLSICNTIELGREQNKYFGNAPNCIWNDDRTFIFDRTQINYRQISQVIWLEQKKWRRVNFRQQHSGFSRKFKQIEFNLNFDPHGYEYRYKAKRPTGSKAFNHIQWMILHHWMHLDCKKKKNDDNNW